MQAANLKLRLVAGAVVLALALAAPLSASAWSIAENEPVRVTHRNSGPRYDFDEVERTKLTPEQANNNNNNKPQNAPAPPAAANNKPPTPADGQGDNAGPAIGHVSIRRIFLVPMMPSDSARDNNEAEPEQPSMANVPIHSLLSSMFNRRPSPAEEGAHDSNNNNRAGDNEGSRPFWPFLSASGWPPMDPHHQQPHHHHRHMLGQDEASRSPSGRPPMMATGGGEREGEMAPPSGGVASSEDQPQRMAPTFDPLQMMLDMMHQAISGQLMPPATDLNKEAASVPKSDDDSKQGDDSALARPQMKPQSQNVTKEDVVEIDGKKFLRKTVVNRHVGDNIIFMTKRLIFIPLNDTEPVDSTAEPKTTTPTTNKPSVADETSTTNEQPAQPTGLPSTTEAPSSTTGESVRRAESTTAEASTEPAQTSSTTSTTTTTTAASADVVPSSSAPTSLSPAAPEEMTTSAGSTTTGASVSAFVEKVSDAIEKAAERLMEKDRSQAAASSSTTPKP